MIKVKRLSEYAFIPTRNSNGAGGYDLYVPNNTYYDIAANTRVVVMTNIAIEIPKGYVGIIKSRSGLAVKKSLDVKAGVIDSDYRGDIGVVLHNSGDEDTTVYGCDRIAQLIIVPCLTVELEEVDDLDDTLRGEDGYGSTGV